MYSKDTFDKFGSESAEKRAITSIMGTSNVLLKPNTKSREKPAKKTINLNESVQSVLSNAESTN